MEFPNRCHYVKPCFRIWLALFAVFFTSCSYDPEFDSLSAFPGNSKKLVMDDVVFVQPDVEKETISEANKLIEAELENDKTNQPKTLSQGIVAFPFNELPNTSGKFVLVGADSTKLDLEAEMDFGQQMEHLLDTPFASRGISCGDFDSDQLIDLLVVDHDKSNGIRLFKNMGELVFEDVTKQVGVDLEDLHVVSTTVVDINNDGLLDFYVCVYDGPNKLFINRGRKFVERSESYGLGFSGASVAASFADMDRDGDLDLYLVTNRLKPKSSLQQIPVDREPGKPPRVKEAFREIRRLIPYHDGGYVPIQSGQYDYLFRNDDSRFTDVTELCLGGKQPFRGMAATWCDFDNDGWPDLYVTNDKKDPDQYFRNLGPDDSGNIKFEDALSSSIKQVSWFAKGIDVGDIDRDGFFDLLIGGDSKSDLFARRFSRGNLFGQKNDAWFLSLAQPDRVFGNVFAINRRGRWFLNMANHLGVADTDCTWSLRSFDFDNDGLLDLHGSNGSVRDFLSNDIRHELERAIESKSIESIGDFWVNKTKVLSANFAFRQLPDGRFENSSSYLAGNTPDFSQSTVICDLDRDGDLDIAYTGVNSPVSILRNECLAGNSIVVKLKGEQSNAGGLGAVLELAGSPHGQQKSCGISNRGFVSSEENLFHFGLGNSEVAKLIIRWPSGTVQTLDELPANHFIVVSEPSRKSFVGRGLQMELDKDMFKIDSGIFDELVSEELPYDDFDLQPMIPFQHSTMGPGMAWSDVDGDGDYDFFVGGCAFEAGRILENTGKQRFQKMNQEALLADNAREDLGALFFDIDNDGDDDLYVTSGGVEDSGAEAYTDRVYLNDGKGQFTKPAEQRLPSGTVSSMAVAAADFDNDRNTDLFVGGRIVPGRYPTNARSALLRNVGGRFQDVTDELAAELKECGMVTACIWSDLNNDRYQDLLVCCEWGPVRVFQNVNGKKLTDITTECGLDQYSGWFSAICGGDVDNDGDMDFAVGNLGTNTAYAATAESPLRIRLGPFGFNQNNRLLETFLLNKNEFAWRSLSSQKNNLEFPTEFNSDLEFASTNLNSWLAEDRFSEAITKEINELRSGLIINTSTDEQIRFDFRPLPDIVQCSPIRGLQLVDVNQDGNLDFYCLHNETAVNPLLEKPNGGFSQLMLGNGDGEFREPASSTGLIVNGVGRSLTIVDLNEDARCDFVAAEVNSKFSTFLNQSSNAPFAIDLRKISERKNFVGAKVRILFGNGTEQLHEVRCGSGYISQSPPIVYSGTSTKGGIESMTIEWPDGTVKTGSVTSLSK